MHASPIAINDKLLSLCPLSLCPNYCLYAVTVGVADGGVADAVNNLHLSLNYFVLPINFVFLSGLTLKPKNQLHLYLFCLFLSAIPTPSSSIVHCRVVLCINLRHRS